MSSFNLYNGDCFDVMANMPDHSIDLILCDLPYGTTANRWDTIIPFDDMWAAYERLIKPKGNIVLFGAGLFAFGAFGFVFCIACNGRECGRGCH